MNFTIITIITIIAIVAIVVTFVVDFCFNVFTEIL